MSNETCKDDIRYISNKLNAADLKGLLDCGEYLRTTEEIDEIGKNCDKTDAARLANALVAIDQHWKSRPTKSGKPFACILTACAKECPPENIFGKSENPDPVQDPSSREITKNLPCICGIEVIDQTLFVTSKPRKPSRRSTTKKQVSAHKKK